jgi:4-hydroxyphenylacetate 3-monooxygenase
MPARTGAEYIAGLQEHVAEVYLYGGQVRDVTTHHALRHGVRTLARLYDMPQDPVLQDGITYVSPTIGERVGLSFVTPRTVQDLERRRTMTTWVYKFLEQA